MYSQVCMRNISANLFSSWKEMPFHIERPVEWRNPIDHVTDFYFCITDVMGDEMILDNKEIQVSHLWKIQSIVINITRHYSVLHKEPNKLKLNNGN